MTAHFRYSGFMWWFFWTFFQLHSGLSLASNEQLVNTGSISILRYNYIQSFTSEIEEISEDDLSHSNVQYFLRRFNRPTRPHWHNGRFGQQRLNCTRRDFTVVWNVPSHNCITYGMDIDAELEKIGIRYNPRPATGWVGPNITIFYADQLGLLPHIDKNGTFVNGGLPQLVNMSEHLKKATRDLDLFIPDPDFDGLGVIDWENWRPLWTRNDGGFKIYQEASIDHVKKEHPSWPQSRVEAQAAKEFETGARSLMEGTLSLARRLRPRGKWGYYLFPECYNWEGQPRCEPDMRRLNDRLLWLFNASSSLYPSAYLKEITHSYQFNKDYIHGQTGEALRIQRDLAPSGKTVPIYLYTRFRYAHDEGYLSERNFRLGLRMSCRRGLDGVVIWDGHDVASTSSRCTTLLTYIRDVIAPAVNSLRRNI